MPDPLFVFFAALTLGGAALLVASRHPVTSAMGMIVALLGIAAEFFLLDAYFLGVLQVLVYAGAVMVLFLFIIMLIDAPAADGAYPWRRAALGLAAAALLGAGVVLLVSDPSLARTAGATPPGLADTPETLATSAKAFGRSLWTKYTLPLQLAGLLLLAALVGVVSLSKAPRSEA